MSLPNALHVVQRFAVDGEYKLRGILRGVRPVGSDPVELGFWIDGKMVHQTKVRCRHEAKRAAARAKSTACGRSFALPSRPASTGWPSRVLRMYEGLPPAYKGPKPAKTYARHLQGDRCFFPHVSRCRWALPASQRPSAKVSAKDLRRQFRPGPARCLGAGKSWRTWHARAYRRPVTEKEVEDLARLVATGAKGRRFL